MALQFETHVRYGDLADGTPALMLVRGDTFEEVHRAAARLAELDRDARFLRDRGATAAVPEYHKGGQYEHFGFADAAHPKRQVNFGHAADTAHPVPFFPKGEEGFYEGPGVPAARQNDRRVPGDVATPVRDGAPGRARQSAPAASADGGEAPPLWPNGKPTEDEPVRDGTLHDEPRRLSRTVNPSQLGRFQAELRKQGWTGPAYGLLLAAYGVAELEDVAGSDYERFLADASDASVFRRYADQVERGRQAKAEARAARHHRTSAPSGPVVSGARR